MFGLHHEGSTKRHKNGAHVPFTSRCNIAIVGIDRSQNTIPQCEFSTSLKSIMNLLVIDFGDFSTYLDCITKALLSDRFRILWRTFGLHHEGSTKRHKNGVHVPFISWCNIAPV